MEAKVAAPGEAGMAVEATVEVTWVLATEGLWEGGATVAMPARVAVAREAAREEPAAAVAAMEAEPPEAAPSAMEAPVAMGGEGTAATKAAAMAEVGGEAVQAVVQRDWQVGTRVAAMGQVAAVAVPRAAAEEVGAATRAARVAARMEAVARVALARVVMVVSAGSMALRGLGSWGGGGVGAEVDVVVRRHRSSVNCR